MYKAFIIYFKTNIHHIWYRIENITVIYQTELIKHINTLKNSESVTHHSISNKIIKFYCKHLITRIMHIVNVIFHIEKFPKTLQISTFRIHKNGN